ncbi:hypothetical protein [Haladaptatus halobius]|uniref:hypothetical protein n=1 Tax=Haladaptatus halobius TaxID=2884875 RepID=UPI001D0B6B87|nr:hypothetical protein [Haladaptatus halobius]
MVGSSLEKQVGVTVGKKALKVGYKRYGIPGAIVTGSVAALGYVLIRRALKSTTGKENVESAINIEELQAQVREKGLGAITNRETLESAINEDELDTNVEIEDVQSEAEEETDELDENIPEQNRESEDAASASSDASASTGSITEETNDSPSAAEPAEAAGPSQDDDVRPETDDEDKNES